MVDYEKLKYGICTVFNEEKYCIRWAEMLHHFCNNVVALVDPQTTDQTVQKLQQLPYMQIEFQDLKLGDSTHSLQGPKKELCMHLNKSKWINDNIKNDDWFIEIACDEMFKSVDYPILRDEIMHAKHIQADALAHNQLLEPVPFSANQLVYSAEKIMYFIDTKIPASDLNYANMKINWECNLRHSRFQRKKENWEQCATPHSNYKNAQMNCLYSTIPIWHLHRIKYGIKPINWSDQMGTVGELLKKYNGLIPVHPIRIEDIPELAEYQSININSDTIKAFTNEMIKPEQPIPIPIAQPIEPQIPMFEYEIPELKRTILLIGDPTEYCSTVQEFYRIFKQIGYNVIWIGSSDETNYLTLNFHLLDWKKGEQSGIMGTYPIRFKEISLASVLDQLHQHIDVIVHFQNNLYFTETTPSKIPYIYICTELQLPRVPELASLVLSATRNGMKHLTYYTKGSIPVGYLPHALSSLYFSTMPDYTINRNYICSFSGELYNPACIYYDRIEIMHFIKDSILPKIFGNFNWMSPIHQGGVRYIEQGMGRVSQQQYKEILYKSKIGINCPTKAGFQFRDLEIPACGAILLTKKTQDLVDLGFKHKKNCLFYTTKENCLELLDEYSYDKFLSAETTAMRKDAYNIAIKQTYASRAIELHKIINSLLE